MSTHLPQLSPFDEHNQKLASNVHPADWVNPTPKKNYHLVVIGAGTAGLVTAAGAAGLGARVALIERELMGGDCLNVGCVPSKGLIHAARVAATVRDSKQFGVQIPGKPSFDFGAAMERMRKLRAQISPNDSASRFTELGVDVFLGQASFVDDQTIRLACQDGSSASLNFQKAVIACGARASAPSIPGLDSVDFLTNETLFSLTELPETLGIIGSGPVGSEMAQTFSRFGSEVYLFEKASQILPREDSDAAAVLEKQFQKDGVQMILNCDQMKISRTECNKICVSVSAKNKPDEKVEKKVDQLLVAAGRAPNTDGLNLDAVNVKFDASGVKVNDNLQTSNPKIFAAGDICSRFKFTHIADFQARIVIQNALFAFGPFGKKKASELLVPWTTYTSPEIAHVGISEREAEAQGIEVDTYTQSFEHVDRAILEGQEEGFVKVHTRKGGDKILGATIVAENAGDLISEITVAMKNGIGLSGLGSTIHPYPTQAEAIRKLGDLYNKTKLTSFNKSILNLLRRINVGS